MIYRALETLRYKKKLLPPGIVSLDLTPEQAARLIAGGFIAYISPPRLDVLPGWETRARKLAKLGILDALQLLQAGDEIPKLLRVKPADFRTWQESIKPWLLPQED